MKFKIIKILIIFTILASFQLGGVDVLSAQSTEKELVYVLHGLGRGKTSMWLLATRLQKAGFDVKRIGYKSLSKTPDEILTNVTEQINVSMPEDVQAVYFVGHSLGGLMIRAYLDSNKLDSLSRVVLIGTPNNGTPIVDKYRDKWWMKMLGPMTLALGTDENSFPNSIADPYYQVGVIAGKSDLINNEKILAGQDDGVVPLASTKLNGMTDIVIIKGTHNMMRYDREVARQTIEFLRNGAFSKQ